MDIKELKNQLEEKLPVYKHIEEEAAFILNSALENKGIKVHSITSRIKSFDSFVNKVNRKQLNKPFDEINDIVGLRVVCLFLSDISRIGDTIREFFTVLSEDNKIEGYDAASFGYLSVHFIATIKKEYSGPRYNKIIGFPLEIQVRTIAMHAWATISHYLDYKTEIDVPKELRRDFYAISGLFYVADTHFELFFKESQQSREKMIQAFGKTKPELSQEINLDSLTAYLNKRFPDREKSDSKTISGLIQELSSVGYKTIDAIEHAINIALDAFILWEKECPPFSKSGKKFTQVGVVRLIFDLIDDKFRIARKTSPVPDKYRMLIKK